MEASNITLFVTKGCSWLSPNALSRSDSFVFESEGIILLSNGRLADVQVTLEEGSNGTSSGKVQLGYVGEQGCENEKLVSHLVIYGITRQPDRVWRSDGLNLTSEMYYEFDNQMLDLTQIGLDFCNSNLLSLEWK